MTVSGIIAQISAFVTHTALFVWPVANDFLIVLVLLAVLFLFAQFVGHGPFVALLISFYAAYALYAVFPYISSLPSTPALTAFLAHIGVYAAFVLVFFLVLRRVIVSDFLYIGTFGLVALSFLGAAFLVALASHIFLISSFYQFTPAVAALFEPNQYFFWWFSAPAIGLLLFAR